MSYYRKTQPIEAPQGIKASKKRGAFGESWWAKRWISVLESFHDGNRLRRGRGYARKGQVTEIHIQRGLVSARVQGSRKSPYKVKIEVDTLSPKMWQLVARNLSKQALYLAKLLAREMPPGIEQVFNESSTPLFPASHHEIQTDCSCPDWSNPCKHVAAVYYLLAEEFDRDPFLIFRLRGIERETFFELLERSSMEEAIWEGTLTSTPSADSPLTPDPHRFWCRGENAPLALGPLVPPKNSATLPKSLGKFPFWRGQVPFEGFLEHRYTKASERARTLLNQSLG